MRKEIQEIYDRLDLRFRKFKPSKEFQEEMIIHQKQKMMERLQKDIDIHSRHKWGQDPDKCMHCLREIEGFME